MVFRKSLWLDAHRVGREVTAGTRKQANPGGLIGSSGLFLSVTVLACACGQKAAEPKPEPAATPAPEVQAAPQPLTFEFKAPEPFKSRDGSKVVPPPDLEAETWRIMVNQTEPMQRKNPWWQPLPADKTVELEMAPGAKFRCMVPPLNVEPEPDEDQAELEAWLLKRSFLCSSDEFRTWTETQLRVRISAKGNRKVGPEAGLLLRQRGDDGKTIETFVIMRSDKDKSGPTYGPPRIVPSPKAEEE